MKAVVVALALLVCVEAEILLLKAEDEVKPEEAILTQASAHHEGHGKQCDGQTKVAFSAGSGLNGNYGPFSAEVTVVFKKVYTNVGNAYNPITGVFTAPVKGVYHFSVSIFGKYSSYWMGVRFLKNEEVLFTMFDHDNGKHKTVTRDVNISLEKGDVVYLKLVANHQIFDDDNNMSSFGGFLLFPL